MQDTTTQSNNGAIGKSLLSVAGIVAVIIGLVGSSFGSAWSPQVYEFLFGFEIVKSIDSFMPYFPLVPFYPIFMMILGVFFIVKSRT